MNNQPDLNLVASDPQAQQDSCEERLEDYLEHLSAPLVGIVPYPERKAFRMETSAHLEGLICEYLCQGQDLHAATETALREFGEPWRVGQAFLQEWLQGSPLLRPGLLIRKATYIAFAWFGTASMLILLILEQSLFVPSYIALSHTVLSYSVLLPGIGLLAFLIPFAAGALVGALSPAQAGRGVRNAVLLLALHSFAVGMLLYPRYEGIVFAGWQLLFWLPAGRISATVTAAWVLHVRRRRFWQIAH